MPEKGMSKDARRDYAMKHTPKKMENPARTLVSSNAVIFKVSEMLRAKKIPVTDYNWSDSDEFRMPLSDEYIEKPDRYDNAIFLDREKRVLNWSKLSTGAKQSRFVPLIAVSGVERKEQGLVKYNGIINPPKVEDYDLPEDWKARAEEIITILLGDPSKPKEQVIRGFDNPNELMDLVIGACSNAETIANLQLRIAFGGSSEVSPRFPSYALSAIKIAQRFVDSGYPSPQIIVMNGANAANHCNHMDDSDISEIVRKTRDIDNALMSAFVNDFAPGIKVQFENDPEWTKEFIGEMDRGVQALLAEAGIMKDRGDNTIAKAIADLTNAGSNHRNADMSDDDAITRSLRYIACHPVLFNDQPNPTSLPGPKIYFVNATEERFAIARAAITRTLKLERGDRVADFYVKGFDQTPTYYVQPGVDRDIGEWGTYRNGEAGGGNRLADSISGLKSIPDPAHRNKMQGAINNWMQIAQFIDPTNPDAGLDRFFKFLENFEGSPTAQEYIEQRNELQKRLNEKKKDEKKPPPPSIGKGDGGNGRMPQPPTPKVDSPSGGVVAVPSAGGGDSQRGQSTNAVGTRRIELGQGRSTDSTDRKTWQDYMRLPSSPHDPSPPWVSGTMDDFIANIATPEVLGEWFTSLNNPQIPHKNKAMIASFVDRALSLQSRGKLNISTSLMKAMQNALDNHIATIRPQNTFPNGVRVNSGQLSQESLANFTKQTMDGWIKEMQHQVGILANMALHATDKGIDAVNKAWATEMQQLPGQVETAKELGENAVKQIQQTAEYVNEMWQSLPPEARALIEKEGLKTIVWTAAASMVLSPFGALAAGPIMTASTDLIVQAVKKGSEILADHPDIPRDDMVVALGGAVASVGLIPFLGPFAPLAGAGAGVMTKRAIQHGVPPLARGTIEHGPHIASSTVKAAAYTIVAGAYMSKAVIQPAAKLLEGHDEIKARIALHGFPVLAATAVGGPALGLAALFATGAIDGIVQGTRKLGDISARGLDREGREAVQDSLNSYIATQSSGDSSAIQSAAEALRRAIGAYGEWVTDDELTSSAQAEIDNAHQHLSEAQARESSEAWANLFGSFANALSSLGKMGSQTETSSSVNHSSEDTSNNNSPSALQHPTSFMPDPLKSYTVAPSIEESYPEPRVKHTSNRTSKSFAPAQPPKKQQSGEIYDHEEYFQPEQYPPIQTTLRPPTITTSPQVRPVPERQSFGELVKSQISSQPRTKSSSSKSPVSPQSSQASSSTASSSPQANSTPPSRVQSTKEIRDTQDEKPEESIQMTAQPSPITETDNNKVRELYATMTGRMEEASALPGVDFVELSKLAEKVDNAAKAGDLSALNELTKVTNQLPKETGPTTPILAKMTSQGLERVNI